jgi:hypothetical protein
MNKTISALCLAAVAPLVGACSNAPDLPPRHDGVGASSVQPAEDARAASARSLAGDLLDRFAADRWSMPPAGSRLSQDGVAFSWELDEAPARAFADTRAEADRAERAGDRPLADRLRRVEVRVWLAEPSGGSDAFDPRLPHAVVARVIDPLAFKGSGVPDSVTDDPDGLERLMDLLRTTEGGGQRP